MTNSAYAQLISETLARIGLVGRYDPAEVEAWMRVEHSTLDGLSAAAFQQEVAVAVGCIDAASRATTLDLCASYGL